MYGKIIDTPANTTPHLKKLKAAGVQTVIRYYNHRDSTSLPEKGIKKSEAAALDNANLSIAVVFQQGNNKIAHFTKEAGIRDGQQAIKRAKKIGQPSGSGIYFAVDKDFYRNSELKAVKSYFEGVQVGLAGGDRTYRMGAYGSGTVLRTLLEADLVELAWLAGARKWSGSQAFLKSEKWHIFQNGLDLRDGKIPHDTNITSPGTTDFGQFSLSAAAADFEMLNVADKPLTMFEVSVSSSLWLRGGPGTQFKKLRGLNPGLQVYGLERKGDWIAVDLSGDGIVDGFAHGSYLTPLVGGLHTLPHDGTRAVDIAYQELERGVREIDGPETNSHIALYYRDMDGVSYDDSEQAWCSYFVNFCVTQTGNEGTNKPNARSWLRWGKTVEGKPRHGDIVVFWRGRRDGWKGHVGFYVGEDSDNILTLSGNQDDAVSIKKYSKSRLLSVRRV
ncbi:TIGR02594 family protein [Parvibaculaceae bacterium PLY_AMNH_Bact1]|nr:TIGR02594 family protein [Parvibaculaceae bacterium PLY_AMNH_Bact1]